MSGQAHQGRLVHDGLSIDYTPGAAVTGGDVVIQNNLVGRISQPDLFAFICQRAEWAICPGNSPTKRRI